MDLSLSIVLPVHNGESTLSHDVHLLLELLPDITTRFEILIVDDASTDQTEEIAYELALQYPQLRVLRHQQRMGQQAAEQTAMTHTTGDVIFVQDEGTEPCQAEIRQLWAMRHDKQLVMARAEAPPRPLSPRLLNHLATWGGQLRSKQPEQQPGGIQMIRREAVDDLEQLGVDMHGVKIRQVAAPKFHANQCTRI